jgi:hypothetical protein
VNAAIVGAGVGVGVGFGLAVGVGVACGVGAGVGLPAGDALGFAAGVLDAVGAAVADEPETDRGVSATGLELHPTSVATTSKIRPRTHLMTNFSLRSRPRKTASLACSVPCYPSKKRLRIAASRSRKKAQHS